MCGRSRLAGVLREVIDVGVIPRVDVAVRHHALLLWVDEWARAESAKQSFHRLREVLPVEPERVVNEAATKAASVGRDPKLAVAVVDQADADEARREQARPIEDHVARVQWLEVDVAGRASFALPRLSDAQAGERRQDRPREMIERRCSWNLTAGMPTGVPKERENRRRERVFQVHGRPLGSS